ncbi:hypothetical protein RY27_24570, partial [Litorilinea aerophila]
MGVLVQDSTTEKTPEALSAFSEESVRALSAARQEPEWMLNFRLDAWRQFQALPWPQPTDEAWRRTRLTGFKLENFQPYARPSGNGAASVSPQIQNELDEMDSAASLVFQDSAVIYRDVSEDLAGKGVIFTDLQQAVQQHPELIQKYFMTEVVRPDRNKFTALHAALWDSGTFI